MILINFQRTQKRLGTLYIGVRCLHPFSAKVPNKLLNLIDGSIFKCCINLYIIFSSFMMVLLLYKSVGRFRLVSNAQSYIKLRHSNELRLIIFLKFCSKNLMAREVLHASTFSLSFFCSFGSLLLFQLLE